MAKTRVLKELQRKDEASKSDGPMLPFSALRRKAEASTSNGPMLPFSRNSYLCKCVPLHQAALKGDWNAAKKILVNDPILVKDPITEGGETALHIAAAAKRAYFVKELVEMMKRSDLDIKNNIGNTALFFAAVTGNVEIAKAMVEKNDMLPTIRGNSRAMPIYMAALLGHKCMAGYLYPLSDVQSWTAEEKIELLTTCIASDLYADLLNKADLALKMVEEDHQLAVAQDKNGETPLHVLARRPSAFASGYVGLWRTFIKILQCIKAPHEKSSTAFKLLHRLWEHTLQQEDLEIPNLSKNASKLLFIATRYGNVDFVAELLRSYPDFLWKVDAHNRSIFHVAVMHRHESIFSLIYEIGPVRELIATYRDNSNNNILHLAATLSPSDQLNSVSGAALQMQRELLWYKAVEKIVHRSYRDMENMNGETPAAIFTKEHKMLLDEGKKWMRETAKSCMIIAALIAVVVFTSSFTVPGGNNNATGSPILLNKRFYMIYSVSEATTMCCSSVSTLMFMSILTSRYAEIDFLWSLHFRLMIGVVTLFLSISGLMVAFCTTFVLANGDRFVRGALLFGAFVCVPLMFGLLKYPLLMDIIAPVYGSQSLFRSHKRLL